MFYVVPIGGLVRGESRYAAQFVHCSWMQQAWYFTVTLPEHFFFFEKEEEDH